MSVDDDTNVKLEPTTSKKRLKRKLKGSNKNVDEGGSESDNTEVKSIAESVEETVNFKKKRSIDSNKSSHENLAEYLEDYFDVIASCQDGARYIANIFHLLPSYKVKKSASFQKY